VLWQLCVLAFVCAMATRIWSSLVALHVQILGGVRPAFSSRLSYSRRSSGNTFLAVLLRTGGPNTTARLESVNKTWGADLEQGSLLTLQPDASCKEKYGDNHWQGLTCLEAMGDLAMMNRTDFEWLLVVDDDVYVFVDRLRQTLKNMDASKPMVYGSTGCGKCANGSTGLCGGGGYALSRQSLLKMASAKEGPISVDAGNAYREHMMKNPNSEWADVRFGCVARESNLELVNVRGMHGNPVEDNNGKRDPAKEHALVVDTDSPALTFHRAAPSSHMEFFKKEQLSDEVRSYASLKAWRL